jgi:hypothetical protein
MKQEVDQMSRTIVALLVTNLILSVVALRPRVRETLGRCYLREPET